MNYNQHASSIKEANEICKMMGKNISFKQCIVQNFMDNDGRSTMHQGSNIADGFNRQLSVKMKEEQNVQVRNHDKNTIVMWSQEDFYDRLDGMRDTLNQFEDSKQKAIEKQKKKQAEYTLRL